ncbi:MAG: phosphoribosylamine--glycine ligase [Syntrophothermus sp.]
MRLLVIGSGGREHALVWKLAQSSRISKIYCVPGNDGIGQIAECVQVEGNKITGIADFAQGARIDLTVVGPETYLHDGIVDEFEKRGMAIFGPSRAAAQIETSKVFAKRLMKRSGVPTARFKVFESAPDARAFAKRLGALGVPLVIKADGLAAGKGVVVAETIEEALQAIDDIMERRVFGGAGRRILIEERLAGPEVSVLAFTDGREILPMLSAQDHKRVFDKDQGPNTGGMGAYAPVPMLTGALMKEVYTKILAPTVAGLAAEGRPYKGVLYAGLMLTPEGPKVIEFNARFGDPETQVILPLMESDLTEILEATVHGRLATAGLRWKDECAATVVMASGGYPGQYETGKVIQGLDRLKRHPVTVFHAGTRREKGKWLTNGGRVLNVTAVGRSHLEAVNKAYKALEELSFEGAHYRRDIAHQVLGTGKTGL